MKRNEKVQVLEAATKIRNDFAKARHGEKKELTNLRFDLALKLLSHRDVFADKRHKERLELLMRKYGQWPQESVSRAKKR